MLYNAQVEANGHTNDTYNLLDNQVNIGLSISVLPDTDELSLVVSRKVNR
jgi:hypothetical protein